MRILTFALGSTVGALMGAAATKLYIVSTLKTETAVVYTKGFEDGKGYEREHGDLPPSLHTMQRDLHNTRDSLHLARKEKTDADRARTLAVADLNATLHEIKLLRRSIKADDPEAVFSMENGDLNLGGIAETHGLAWPIPKARTRRVRR
jgi:hypothetical protein